MKRQIVILLILLFPLFVLLSCNDNKPAISNKKQEDFNSFFMNFKQDEKFQLSRIKYPLEYWEYTDGIEPSDYKYIQTFIPKTKKRYNDFQFNHFSEEIVSKSDTTIVQIRGLECGLYIDYFFTKNNGRWQLVKVEDTSN